LFTKFIENDCFLSSGGRLSHREQEQEVIKKNRGEKNGRSHTHKEQNGRIVKTGQKERGAADLPPPSSLCPSSLSLSLLTHKQLGKKNFYFPEASRSTPKANKKRRSAEEAEEGFQQRREEREAHRSISSALRGYPRLPSIPLSLSLSLSLSLALPGLDKQVFGLRVGRCWPWLPSCARFLPRPACSPVPPVSEGTRARARAVVWDGPAPAPAMRGAR
jgi:hypothetical protein